MGPVRLNNRAYEHAKWLIKEGKCIVDNQDDWDDHQPKAKDENDFIEKADWLEYGRWYLGLDDAEPVDTKGRYKFPFGDFDCVHRCGVLAAKLNASQYKYDDIEQAATHLHGLLKTHA